MKLEKFTVGELKNPTKETRDKLNTIVEELNKLHKENNIKPISLGGGRKFI